jgi:hypothetical protein
LKSVSKTCYICSDANDEALRDSVTDRPASPGLSEDFPMTIEILYLTAQIHRWLNERVARYIAAQAAKLTH